MKKTFFLLLILFTTLVLTKVNADGFKWSDIRGFVKQGATIVVDKSFPWKDINELIGLGKNRVTVSLF